MTNRPRGVMVYPMPDEIGGPSDRYALLMRGDEARMVHTEGVAYLVNADNAWTWTDYNPAVKKWTLHELIVVCTTIEPVDLADWVRTFGARLESNFHMVHHWAISQDADHCDCGDPACRCDCIPGRYPCEHGSMGEGCGA